MSRLISAAPRRPELPWLFCYDISCNRRRRKVLDCLRRWRLDGQLSVHETLMRPVQVRELATELLELVDRDQDRLISCRLNQRGDGPVYRLSGSGPVATLLGSGASSRRLPRHLHDGWYLLAYDVRDPRRLQRAQRRVIKSALFLQRSLYLFRGTGGKLRKLLQQVCAELDPQADDLRLYALSGPADLWVLSGPTPSLPGIAGPPPDQQLWSKLLSWLGLAKRQQRPP